MGKINFSAFENTRKTAQNQPDYNITMKNEGGTYAYVGGIWIKEGARGDYLSGQIDLDKVGEEKPAPKAPVKEAPIGKPRGKTVKKTPQPVEIVEEYAEEGEVEYEES